MEMSGSERASLFVQLKPLPLVGCKQRKMQQLTNSGEKLRPLLECTFRGREEQGIKSVHSRWKNRGTLSYDWHCDWCSADFFFTLCFLWNNVYNRSNTCGSLLFIVPYSFFLIMQVAIIVLINTNEYLFFSSGSRWFHPTVPRNENKCTNGAWASIWWQPLEYLLKCLCASNISFAFYASMLRASATSAICALASKTVSPCLLSQKNMSRILGAWLWWLPISDFNKFLCPKLFDHAYFCIPIVGKNSYVLCSFLWLKLWTK